MLSEVGLNPTGLLPGAISIAESVGMKEYEQFSFIYRAWPECYDLSIAVGKAAPAGFFIDRALAEIA